ncbi:PH-like domain-containing protein [Pseudarthrobacter sp. TAF60_1]|uniref:PH-like domain-containing protein n=1 Tax=Pseudarthrobacter sp. TAF60_1 TaxID=3233071 RepID=UPI003F9BED3F
MDTQTLSLVSTVAIIAVVLVLMGIGWRNRLRRQADVDPLPPVPAEPGAPTAEADGQYVASTTAGDWLDRIAVHSLGIRTNAVLSVYPHGVLLDRSGSPAVYIPAGSLTAVRQESGMAGKFVEKDGLLVLTWDLGTHSLDTGFRTRRAADKDALYDSLQQLIAAAPQEHSQDPQSGK